MSHDITRWFAEVSGADWLWYARYLSANDTLATGAHQAGPYLPKLAFGTLFPSTATSRALNPSTTFPATIEPAGMTRVVRAIWYNNRVVAGGTRNECRITGWGGASSPLLDPDATGSLCVMAFRLGRTRDAEECRIWLCSDLSEEQVALDLVGMVEPGAGTLISPEGQQLLDLRIAEQDMPCVRSAEALPLGWLESFPEAAAIVDLSISCLPSARTLSPDARLLKRRDCEYQLFRSVEEAYTLPRVREGFDSVDHFVAFANSVTNRRKSRSGLSLELQTSRILAEEGISCSHGAEAEGGKRPDFIFPSIEKYHDQTWPEDRLLMLAAKSTCKDRWRQVIDEADRIPVKHLLTLQQGVSESQYSQMRQAGVRLVVPHSLHASYPKSIRADLVSLSAFLAEAAAIVIHEDH